MDQASTAIQGAFSIELPDHLRKEFEEGLRLANGNLRGAASAIRSVRASRSRVDKAIGDAWTNLASIERVVGLSGTVSRASSTKRFLVVDDNPDVRFLVSRALRSMSPLATVEAASNATEALLLLEDAGPGEGVMVISDHDMGPGATGVDLLAQVASRHPRSHRILFTGHPIEEFPLDRVKAHAVISKDAGHDALRRYFGAP